MPDRVVDTHMRFWDLSTGWYPAIYSYAESVNTPELTQAFGVDEYLDAAADFPVQKFVHVAAATTGRYYLDELKWISGLAADRSVDMRFIGNLDPRLPETDIIADLDAQLAIAPDLAGIHVIYDFAPDSPAVRPVLTWLNEHGLVFDLVAQPDEVTDWLRVLAPFPDLTVALEHTGFPTSPDDDVFAEWLAAIQTCARDTAMYCKVSGLSLVTNTFAVAALRRWVEPAIETFGWDRVMFGSNFPVHRIAGTYVELQQAYEAILGDQPPADQDRFYAANAIKAYGFDDD
ncbi:amidohydrolase family protein [Gordonia sp. CPCC 205515]|uniref:amidohydrolase family protein n=1 Tax=Gordonia sp. CPCC 205515 TaxID=3140791 RepID=UPI003AF39BE8